MKRSISFLFALLSAPVMAQTTLDITVPGTGNPVCSYVTGPVTNESTPGHLQATATSSSGAGCGSGSSGNVTFGPASPLSPQSTTIATGSSVSYSFQALNATSCSATITGAASGSFTGGNTLCSGTGSSSCANRVTASASFTNSTQSPITDTVTLTCTGTSGQAQSLATVTVNGSGGGGGGGSCATVVKSDGTAGVTNFTQQGTTQIRVGGDQHTITADMTSYSAVFGTFPSTGTIAYDILPISNYISMKVLPSAGFFAGASSSWHSKIGVGTSNDDAKVSVTISTKCGDFSNPATDSGSSVVSGCYKVGLIEEGGVTFSGPTGTAQCKLTDSTQGYYFNLINANITNVTSTGGTASSYRDGPGSTCAGQASCSVPIENLPSSYP